MKYCRHCGTQLEDDAAFCTNCGKSVDAVQDSSRVQPQMTQAPQQKTNSSMQTAINVLLIIACVFNGLYTFGIALAWCIPMTLKIRERMRAGIPVGVALKICTLIFVNLISGILLLCLDDETK